MQALKTLCVGPNSVTFEPPDTTFVVFAESIDGTMMSQLLDHMVELARGEPYMLFIFDVTRLTSMSQEARKIMISNGHRLPPRVLSYFGASFTIRVIHELLMRASARLGSGTNRFVHHSSDEKSARAWANEMRPVLWAKARALANSERSQPPS